MRTMRLVLWFINILLVGIFLISCALPRRQLVNITSFDQMLSINSAENITIEFEETLHGKPLKETVWDNVAGPFWNVEESQQIGFTQNYKPQFFAIPPVLLPAFAQSGMHLIDTQIVIPFGRIFSGVFESAAKKHFASATICFDDTCVKNSSSSNILKIKVDQFLVWERPLNHLNLYAKGKSNHILNGSVIKTHEFEKSLLTQKLGSVFSTHSGFIKEMNRLSNQFAKDCVAEIIKNGL